MSTTESILLFKKLRTLSAEIEGTREIFKDYIKNKEHDLLERWKMFKTYGNLFLDIDNDIVELTELKINNIGYSYHLDYKTKERILFVELVERIKELESLYSQSDIKRLKEEILELGYYGFILDY